MLWAQGLFNGTFCIFNCAFVSRMRVKLLAIDTATRMMSVALLDGQKVVEQDQRDVKGAQARWLIPTIHQVLHSHGWTVSHLQGLAVSTGPGSFTGLRVGLATMVALRMVKELPLAAVPTLEGMAWSLRTFKGPLCPIIKGRAGEAYWALYQWEPDGRLKVLREEQVGPVERITELLTEPTTLFGDGWEAYQAQLREQAGHNITEVPNQEFLPWSVGVGWAGIDRLNRGEYAPRGVAPRYIQPAEAELMWKPAPAESFVARATKLSKRRTRKNVNGAG